MLEKKEKRNLNFSLASGLKIKMRLNHKIKLKKLGLKLHSEESKT